MKHKIAQIIAGVVAEHYLQQGHISLTVKRSPNGSLTAHITVMFGDGPYAIRISDHTNPNPNHYFPAELIVTDETDIKTAVESICRSINIDYLEQAQLRQVW